MIKYSQETETRRTAAGISVWENEGGAPGRGIKDNHQYGAASSPIAHGPSSTSSPAFRRRPEETP